MAEKKIEIEIGMTPGAESAMKTIGKDVKEASEGEKRYQDLLRKRIEHITTEKRLREDLSRAGVIQQRQELSHEEKYERYLRGRVDYLEKEKRLRQDLSRMGYGPAGAAGPTTGQQIGAGLGQAGGALGGVGLPQIAGPAAAVAVAVKALDTTLSVIEKSFERGTFSEGKYKDEWYRETLFKIPFAGRVYQQYSRNDLNAMFGGKQGNTDEDRTSYADRERHIKESHLFLQEQARRQAAFGTYDTGMMHLRGQQAEAEARLRYGSTSLGSQFGITTTATAGIEGQLAGAGGTLGYNRQAQEADIIRQGQFRANVARTEVEQKRQLQVLDAQAAQAGKERLDLEQRLKEQRADEAKDVEKINRLKNRGLLSGEAEGNARRYLEAKQMETQRLEEQLRAASGAEMGFGRQREDLLKQSQAQTHALKLQEYNALTGVIQSEQSRIKGTQESFGLLAPFQKQGLLNIARKLNAGQNLQGFELAYAQQHEGFLGNLLRQQGARNAGPEFEELKRLTGMDARLNQATELRGKLEQEIKVDIKVGDQALTDQLSKQIFPQIQNAMTQLQLWVEERLKQIQNEMWQQRNALMGPS